MKKLQIYISVWYDETWRAHTRRSWKKRRYWMSMQKYESVKGDGRGFLFGPVTIKVRIEKLWQT